ncbi:MAG TPA: type II toxin-antitoxin system VapC family toxin [Candidatus Acidoferrales bacterium]|nr:type II toxin-antitoxin system VapC family toxin [Candidatus Acidoferrales bacterium]
MSRVVLDASALLAVLHAERGAEKMTPALLAAALISAVNLAEVQTKLVSRGVRPGDAWDAALSVVCEVVPFSKEHARKAGDLALQTRSLGLGLGDRACLALALSLGVPVYTADASWSRLKIGAAIHVIR